MAEYTESVSGFKIRGDWNDIVAHGEMIAEVLSEIGQVDDEFRSDLDEYDSWRPKIQEKIDREVAEKTAKKASIDDATEEKSVTDKVSEAQKKANMGAGDITDNNPNEAFSEFNESAKSLIQALQILSKKSIKSSEEAVYKNIMTTISPYYFDNKLVSANLKEVDGDVYELEVDVNDDDIKSVVSDKLENLRSVDDWHVEANIDKSIAKDVEGFEDV